jgi:hypothetical protein
VTDELKTLAFCTGNLEYGDGYRGITRAMN